jgi:CHAD domain-containing protein
MPYCHLAAQYIRRQAKTLAKQLDGVCVADDIEYVHRARVATRRLRAALNVFAQCFDSKKVKRWQKALQRIALSLGDARDRDVQIDFLCGMLPSLEAKECFPGIARILTQLEYDRERLQRKVIRGVKRLKSDGSLRAMRRAAKRVLAVANHAGCDGSSCGLANAPSRQFVLDHLAALRKYQSSLADPTACQRHHAMRIAAKHLRYTLEILRPLCAGQLDEYIEAAKTLQSLLGEVHDCDVWLDHLAAFATAEYVRAVRLFGAPRRFLHLQPGIALLQENRLQHRRQAFEQLTAYWAKLEGRRLWDQFEAVAAKTACFAMPKKNAENESSSSASE